MQFSVVIPLYNKEDTISRALKSVAAQEFRDFEVIVIDDGSKDAGAKVVEEFSDIARLRMIRQENSGVSAARNRGAHEATGEYVAFLDADDCWLPQHLAELAKIIGRFHDSVLIGTGFYWHIGGKVLKTRETGRIEKVDLLPEVALFQPVHTSSIAVRRKEFLEIGGFDEQHGYFEDIELMFKLALKYPEQIAVSRHALVRHLDDAVMTITKGSSTKRQEAPHLELANRVASERESPRSVKRFARRFALRTFANQSFRFQTLANAELVAKYPELIRLCRVGRVFASPAVRFLVWPIAVAVKSWYWLALRRALVHDK